jgi:hypothetical protein
MNLTRILRTVLFAAVLSALTGCSNEDSATDKSAPALVSPDDAYGKSYAEWAAGWVQFASTASPPECKQVLTDETGEDCALNQDADSDVFYLVGNQTGVSVRDKCVVPADKALFFPLINVWADNAGVPTDMLYSEEEIKSYIQDKFDGMDAKTLVLTVDGKDVANLASGGIAIAPYTLVFETKDNVYACNGSPDVVGEFPGFLSGYWAMLPPLSAGSHDLRFAGTQHGATSADSVTIDQTYHLRVE